MSKIGKPYVIGLIFCVLLYIAVTIYQIASIEHRLGKIEHFLVHQGFDTDKCHKCIDAH